MKKKPVILLTTGHAISKMGMAQYAVNKTYAKAISAAGGLPVLAIDPNEALAYSQFADGLLLTGGPDIAPEYYGENILDNTVFLDVDRDHLEFPIFDSFKAAKKPIMGICRGFQVINVALGGSLWQDLPSQKGVNHADGVCHSIAISKGSQMERWFGNEMIVNSYHHQAVKKVGDGLVITAMSGEIPEAYEHETLPIFALQCHPERMTGGKTNPPDGVDTNIVFRYFVDLCAR